MDTYTKLFGSILDSTIWMEPLTTRIMWITMLAMCDRNGEINSSIPGLADRAKVELPECEAALKRFMSPDPYSRTKEHEGRRIEEIDGGWRLLNHSKYREKMSYAERREYQRKWQADYRKKKKGNSEDNAESFIDSLREENGDGQA